MLVFDVYYKKRKNCSIGATCTCRISSLILYGSLFITTFVHPVHDTIRSVYSLWLTRNCYYMLNRVSQRGKQNSRNSFRMEHFYDNIYLCGNELNYL